MSQINARKRGKFWEYRFEVASIDGKRKQKSKGGFRTKAEALRAGTEALAEYNNTGIVPVNTDMSFADLLDTWYEEYVEPNLSIHTCNNYKSQIARNIKPVLGSYRVTSLTHSTLQQLLNSLQDKYAANTINTVRGILKGSLRYACQKMGIIKYNPASELTVPRNAAKVNEKVGSYSLEFIKEVLGYLNGQPYYAVLIASKTGMRIGEIFALEWEDIDFDKKTITITKSLSRAKHDGLKHTTYVMSTPKTDSSTRKIFVDDELLQELQQLKKWNEENEAFYGEYYRGQYLGKNNEIETYDNLHAPAGKKKLNMIMRMEHGGMYLKDYVYEVFRNLEKEKGINFRFHNLRHSHATILIENGVSPKAVQDRLGHSNIHTTLNLYVDTTDAMREESVHAFEKAWTNRGQKEEKEG